MGVLVLLAVNVAVGVLVLVAVRVVVAVAVGVAVDVPTGGAGALVRFCGSLGLVTRKSLVLSSVSIPLPPEPPGLRS